MSELPRSQDEVKKEFGYTLIGVLLFLSLILFVGIAAFFRPMGQHVVMVNDTGIASATMASATKAGVAVTNLTDARNEPIKVISVAQVKNPAAVELGKKLYFDGRLSKSGSLSCNSCHNLGMGGSDNLTTSIGHKWTEGPINAPTVLNSRYSLAQFWDGRAKNLQEQAGGPIQNPKEMASTHAHVVQVLNSIPMYKDEFHKTFGTTGDITISQVTDAIAQFEETLVTPNSRFDQWLAGDDNAINAQELRGYQLFKNAGCVACHNGPAVGGGSYQKLGVFSAYTTKNTAQGRFDLTKNEADRMMFKVPTLRNVALTYPYFHDGQVKSLSQAVDIMGKLQLNRSFSKAENADIVAFLKTLTGDQPKIAYPVLPPSNDDTPTPDPYG